MQRQEDCWNQPTPQTTAFRFSGRPCLTGTEWGEAEMNTWHPPMASPCVLRGTHMSTHIHVHTCTQPPHTTKSRRKHRKSEHLFKCNSIYVRVGVICFQVRKLGLDLAEDHPLGGCSQCTCFLETADPGPEASSVA